MKNKIKNMMLPIVLGVFVITVFLYMLLRVPSDYSNSERRVLKKAPAFTFENVISGRYMEEFEEFALDQFIKRDIWRSIKAIFAKNVLLKKDNNDIYVVKGYASKLEYPLDYRMLDNATDNFEYIYKKYLENKNIRPYLVIVPDKNYYLAKPNNYLSMDYEKLYDYTYEKTAYMKHIDIRDKLSVEDYYYTDTHWKQDCIVNVAETVKEQMGNSIHSDYIKNKLDVDFYGVYYGQSALPLKPDKITYLTSDIIDKCIVTSYDTGKPEKKAMYNIDKASSKDGYEMFLEGSQAIITIDNPNADTDKELVIFRDSFASSLAPLLVENYKKITLVDTRYVKSSMVGAFVNFDNADVIFMYSTLILNNSLGL